MSSQSDDSLDRSSSCDALDGASMVDIFTNVEIILFSIFASAVFTLPAISVYYRKTEQRPSTMYFYSCVLKFVTGFFGSSATVGGFVMYFRICSEAEKGDVFRTTISFIAALVVEIVEFMIDLTRLVMFFGDPRDTLDLYQNVRWNSTGVSNAGVMTRFAQCFITQAPLLVLMCFMWIFILLTNIASSFGIWVGLVEGSSTLSDLGLDGFSYISIWFIGIVFYSFLAFSCIGGYHLFRMCSSSVLETLCCRGTPLNSGEDKGTGYYWSRFKVIAVDMPSILILLFGNNASSLVLFWTSEFINDIVPMIVPMIVEMFLMKEDKDKDKDEEEGKQDNGTGNIEEFDNVNDKRGKKISNDGNVNMANEVQSIYPINFSSMKTVHIKLIILMTKNEGGQQQQQQQSIGHEIDIKSSRERKAQNSRERLTKLMDEERSTKPQMIGYRIDRNIPDVLVGEISQLQWQTLCDKTDEILETADPIVTKPKQYTTKVIFIGLGLFLTWLFWFSWSRIALFDINEGTITNKQLFWICFSIIFVIMTWSCFKVCFKNRDLPIESEIIEEVENICNSETADNIHFQIAMKKQTVFSWCLLRGGFSCKQGIQSIHAIECLVVSELNDQEASVS
mmetsp:Transcript_1170/g.1590  ORF Transcript_1170/g.1590 Transcript_1170/m.1590 type:complete len:620 (-) Transcript_1170:45-1904(-)